MCGLVGVVGLIPVTDLEMKTYNYVQEILGQGP